MKNYLMKPRVQQAILKASRFGPARRNILNQIIAQEADQEQQKRLWALNQASQNYYRNKALKENEKRFNATYAARDSWNDYLSDRADIGTGISVADAAMSGVFGYNKMMRDKEYAKKRQQIGDRLLQALGE